MQANKDQMPNLFAVPIEVQKAFDQAVDDLNTTRISYPRPIKTVEKHE